MTQFLCGVATTLIIQTIALKIATAWMKRKMTKGHL